MLELEYVVGLVMGLIQIIKKWVSPEYLPFVAVVLGAGVNLLNAVYFGGDPKQALKDGIVAAGLAVGIFSGIKNTFQK